MIEIGDIIEMNIAVGKGLFVVTDVLVGWGSETLSVRPATFVEKIKFRLRGIRWQGTFQRK